MLQTIDGREVYVVDFNTIPATPITGVGKEEPYAIALTAAIDGGLITEPGKYGIHVTTDFDGTHVWNVYHIIE